MDQSKETVPNLGKLEAVDIREVWKSEPLDFTPWLAEQQNLDALSEAIGIGQLELIQTEQQVSEFSVDIVAHENDNDVTVIIESQLDDSDHKHIGQCLTYAAGTDAKIIIWVVKSFKEGHLAALDWLNNVTEEDIGFFGVEVEAWKIGGSLPAPRFNVRVRPNHWVKTLRHSSSVITPVQRQNVDYWSAFGETARANDWPRSSSPTKGPNIWKKIAEDGDLEIWLHGWIDRNEPAFAALSLHFSSNDWNASERLNLIQDDVRAHAATQYDVSLMFKKMNTRKPEFFVQLESHPDDKSKWDEQHLWFVDSAKKLTDLYKNYIRAKLDL